MPDKCPDCGQITDWNDFGAEDGSSESQCVCPPRVGGREWFWVEGQRWLFDDDAGWVRGDGEPAPPRVLAGLKRLFARPSPFRRPTVTFTSEPSVDNGGSQPTGNPQDLTDEEYRAKIEQVKFNIGLSGYNPYFEYGGES